MDVACLLDTLLEEPFILELNTELRNAGVLIQAVLLHGLTTSPCNCVLEGYVGAQALCSFSFNLSQSNVTQRACDWVERQGRVSCLMMRIHLFQRSLVGVAEPLDFVNKSAKPGVAWTLLPLFLSACGCGVER